MVKEKTFANYSVLIYRHLDRMSESLTKGLEIGQLKNSTFLMSYYLFVLHFESLINTYITAKAYARINEYKSRLPSFKMTYTGRLEDNIKFLNAVSEWFQVLLIVANNAGFIAITAKKYEEAQDDMSKLERGELEEEAGG